VKRIRMLSIGRVNIEFFPGWKKIKQRRISFVLGYLRMILWQISTAIYLYGFLNQSLDLILGNIFFIKITPSVPLITGRISKTENRVAAIYLFYISELISWQVFKICCLIRYASTLHEKGVNVNYKTDIWLISNWQLL
jgi:hypothetical protein